ncbi:MAG: LL-diaminopimelate aminotransferase [Oscillospiraceae bacterium]
MLKINSNFNNLISNYLFAEVSNRVSAFKKANPNKTVISMGIGDVTLPLSAAVVDAMKAAAEEMGKKETFRGYGPYEGYEFLHDAIKGHYASYGVCVDTDEIFVGDGAKNDLGSIVDLFGQGNTVIIPDPVYPAYVDVNVLCGNKIIYVDGNEQNGFLPAPPSFEADIIYLCSPNNPTGAVYSKDGLKAWVEYANSCGAVILFDSAYESFIRDKGLPHSIYEIDGSRTCAIELCSFSKTAGFTGTRCGYTVIPHDLERGGMNLRSMWARRAAAKYNGTSYVIQRAAAAVFSAEGINQTRKSIDYYLNNAKIMSDALRAANIEFVGGDNSPYIWFKCPNGIGSWEIFDLLLNSANVVCTPGAGFGKSGEGRCRLTAFGGLENTEIAMEQIVTALSSIKQHL